MLKQSAKGGIRYFFSESLDKRGVVHGFLARTGGASPPPFNSLNFDDRGADTPENIIRNRELFKNVFGLSALGLKNLVIMNQVHGSSVIAVDSAFDFKRPDADAAVTNLKHAPLGILTADCMPALFYDPANKAIGAAHAGWKGTLEDVCVKTIKAMRGAFGSRPEEIIAAFGPYIGPCCYNVKDDMLDKFKTAFGGSAQDFFVKRNGLCLNIGKANLNRLLSAGLRPENISSTAPCTSCENSRFFSYRKENGKTGRQLSFIMLSDR